MEAAGSCDVMLFCLATPRAAGVRSVSGVLFSGICLRLCSGR